MDGDLVGDGDRPVGLTRPDVMEDLAIRVRCGDLDRYDQLRHPRYGIRNGSWLRSASRSGGRASAFLSGYVSRLQDVIDPPIPCCGRTGSHVAIGRVDGRAHVIGIGPGGHDLIDAHAAAAHGKIFRRPHGAAAAISRSRDPAAYIADVPGHIIGRHGRCRRLGYGVDDGILDERREPIRDAQRVHRQDQFIGVDLA